MNMISRDRKNNHPRQIWAVSPPAFALLLLVVAALSCVLDPIVPTPSITPSPQTGTDYLSYYVPNFAVTLQPGQPLLGTGVFYESRNNTQYNLSVDNKPEFSGGTTTVRWFGMIIPSVFARYDLQLTPVVNTDNLNAAGNVRLVVVRPNPSEIASLPAEIAGAVRYSGVLVNETAFVGQRIAGTSLHYDGESSGAAAFSGTFQSGLRPLGSSIIWYGQLVNNVYIQHNLAVTNISADSVTLEGTADIYVIPE
jgi:hypothetical protein